MSKKNRVALIKENNTDIDDFPPVLRKLAEKVMEKYNFSSIKELCDNEDINYQSVHNAMSRARKKGNDFGLLIYSLLEERNKNWLGFVDNKVFEKALESDMRAAELFYKRAGAIKTGSGGDRVQVNNQVNLTFMSPLPDKDTIEV